MYPQCPGHPSICLRLHVLQGMFLWEPRARSCRPPEFGCRRVLKVWGVVSFLTAMVLIWAVVRKVKSTEVICEGMAWLAFILARGLVRSP